MTLIATAKRLLPTNRFARSVTILAGGTAAGQALLVLAAPILTRLYTPEDFGLLAVFAALLAVISVIASLRYELAIPLPEDDLEAAHVVALGLILVACMATASAALILAFSGQISKLLGVPAMAGLFWLLPPAILLSGAYGVFSYWATRTKAFPAIAQTRLVQAVATLALQIGGYGLGALGLILGQAVGQGAGAGRLGAIALRQNRGVFAQVRPGGILLVAQRYRKFPIYSSWNALLNTAGTQLAPLMFAAYFGAAMVGLYALALRVISIPVSVVGQAVGQVFFSEAPAARRKGDLKVLVEGLHARLAMIGALPLAILVFFGPELFEIVFGAQWRSAGVYAQWMAPWIYLQFQWSPLSTLASVLDLQREALIQQIISFIVRVGSVAACVFFGIEALPTLKVFAIVSALVYVGRIFWFMRRAGVNLFSLMRTEIIAIACGFFLAGLAHFLLEAQRSEW